MGGMSWQSAFYCDDRSAIGSGDLLRTAGMVSQALERRGNQVYRMAVRQCVSRLYHSCAVCDLRVLFASLSGLASDRKIRIGRLCRRNSLLHSSIAHPQNPWHQKGGLK
jgi:hypothetical protein